MDTTRRFEEEVRHLTPAGHRLSAVRPSVREQALLNLIDRMQIRIALLETRLSRGQDE